MQILKYQYEFFFSVLSLNYNYSKKITGDLGHKYKDR